MAESPLTRSGMGAAKHGTMAQAPSEAAASPTGPFWRAQTLRYTLRPWVANVSDDPLLVQTLYDGCSSSHLRTRTRRDGQAPRGASRRPPAPMYQTARGLESPGTRCPWRVMIGLLVLALLAIMLIRCFSRPGVVVAPLLLYFTAKQLVQLSLPYFAENTSHLDYVFFGGVSLAWIFRVLSGHGRTMLEVPSEYALQLLFIVLAFVSTLWSMDTEVREHALAVTPRLVLFALVAPSLLADTRWVGEAFQWIAWVGGGMSLLFLFAFPEASDASRLVLAAARTSDDLILNPLAVGAMGSYVMVTSVLGMFPRHRLVSFLRLVAACAGLVVAGRSSRGDMFAGIVAVAFLGLIPSSATRGLHGRRLVAAVAGAVLFATVLYYGLFLTSYWLRYENVAEDVSVLHREFMLRGVLEYYMAHPTTWVFGAGWCSSYAIVGFYPHSGPVQALTEMGIVGALIWLASVAYASTRALRLILLASRAGSRSLDVVRPALALMFCCLISNLKSGDCVDVWLALTLAMVSQLIRRFYNDFPRCDVRSQGRLAASTRS